MKKINIELAGNFIEAGLNDTDTAVKIMENLPLEGNVSRWGDELYFSIPVEADLEDGTEILEEGDLAFWPPGNAFCIFFGPTPVSTDNRPRSAGPVTVIGKILEKKEIKLLRQVPDGQLINIT